MNSKICFVFCIYLAFGQQVVPLVPSDADWSKPWVGAFHPNGSVPVGKTYWKVQLDQNDLPNWVFNQDNDTGLNMEVVHTCEFNMTFEVAKVHGSSEVNWNAIYNSTNKGTVTYCDVDRKDYQLIVENKGSQTCDYVEIKVYVGVGEAVCILESLAKAWLKILIICLCVGLGICVIGVIACCACGCTAFYCCCKKKNTNYNRMQHQNNYVAPPPTYNQPGPNPAHVQNAPAQYIQPVYQPNQPYVQQPNQHYVQQPNQPHMQQQNYPTGSGYSNQQPPAMNNYNSNAHSEHV